MTYNEISDELDKEVQEALKLGYCRDSAALWTGKELLRSLERCEHPIIRFEDKQPHGN